MPDQRPALRSLPKYDPDNGIGAVDRVRFAIKENLTQLLTQDEHDQLTRWKQVDDFIREDRISGQRQLRNLMMERFNITWSTAERDIINAKELFRARHDDNEYFRSVYIDEIEETAEKARKVSDFKAYEKLKRLSAEMRGIDKPKKEEIPYDKLQGFNIIMEYNPEAVGFKTLPNKDELYEKYKGKKEILQAMADKAEEAELDGNA